MLKRSIVIAGRHETSISIEEEFFEELQLIAREKNLSLNQLVTHIDNNRDEQTLSCAVRVYILRHIKSKIS